MVQLRYVHLAYNNIPISGEDASYQLGDYGFSRNPTTVTLDTEILVVGTGAADLQTKVAALEPLTKINGTLVVQLGRELELDDGVGNGTTTFTSATGGFLAAHIGLWITIRGVGSRRIDGVGSSTSITLNSSVASDTGYRVVLCASHFIGTHAANTFSNGEGSLSPGDSKFSTELSRAYRFSVSGAPELSVESGMESSSISIRWDPSRRRTATLSGTFVPFDYDDDDVVENAKANYDFYIGTFITNHLSGFGGESVYELTEEEQSYDGQEFPISGYASSTYPSTKYKFRRTYKERFEADAVGIIDQTISVTRGANASHGLKNAVGKVTADVSYSAAIDHDVVTWTGLRAYYVSTIRPLIRAAISQATGASTGSICAESESYTFRRGNVIAATWRVYLPTKSSQILSFDKGETITEDPGKSPTIKWDGADHTYAVFPIGAKRTRTIVTRVLSQKPVKIDSEGNVKASGVQIGTTASGGGGDEGKLESKGLISVSAGVGAPKSTKVGAKKSGKGEWVEIQPSVLQESSVEVGKTIDGGGGRATIYDTSMTRNYVWMIPSEDVTPAFKGVKGHGITMSGSIDAKA